VFGILFSSSLLALFIPGHAVAAIMFQVVAKIAQTPKLKRRRNPLGVALFLAIV
jgi:hypothetical protein